MVELHEEAGELPGGYRGIFAGLPAGAIALRAAGPGVDSLLAAEGRSEPVEQLINVDIKGSTESSDPVCNLPLLNQIADAKAAGWFCPLAAVANAVGRL